MLLGLVPVISLLLAPLVHSGFTPKDLVSAPRTGPALPNPNGTFAVYTQVSYSFDNDTRTGGLYLIPIVTPKHTTDTVDRNLDAETAIHPLWIVNSSAASDPQWISNSTLIYISPTIDGSELRSLNIDTLKSSTIQKFDADISNLEVHCGKKHTRIAFSAKVNQKGEMVPRNETETPEILVYDRLWVRHWDEWITPLKNSIFAATLSPVSQTSRSNHEQGFELKGLRNMLSGIDIHDLESPIPPWGGTEDYSLSESYLAFVAKDPHLNPATNTASHVYIVSFEDEKYPVLSDLVNGRYVEKLNRGPGASSAPEWSPCGEMLGYLEMRIRGYESDRRRVVIFKFKTHEYTYPTEEWDRSPQSILWSQDSKSLYLTTEDQGHIKLFHLPLHSTNSTPSTPNAVITKHSLNAVHWANDSLLVTQSSLVTPSFISVYAPHKSSKQFSNGTLLPLYTPFTPSLSPTSVQEFWFPGFNAHPVHGFMYLPENFDRKRKYPMAFLIHGGPQGAWEDGWSTRWNPAVFANANLGDKEVDNAGENRDGMGWVVVAINPTGSTGYGQKFTDDIQGNWGTIPYWDLEAGYDYLLNEYEFIDPERTVALGASYGGYMINWIQGHPLGRKFKALVWYPIRSPSPTSSVPCPISKSMQCINLSHDGIFSTLNGFYSTEELYFPEHEFLGTPWDKESVYQTHNPANYVENWKTPQLVIHGSKESEGLSAFTALQRRGIPSKLVIFRNENHWVLNPRNSLKWHEEVLSWITKWTSHPHAQAETQEGKGGEDAENGETVKFVVQG